MSKWADLLDRYINLEIRAPECTDETDRTPWTQANEPRNITKSDGSVSSVSDFSGPRFKNTPEAETVIERAAIHEYDASMARDRANMKASAAYDAGRQMYEQFYPDRDPAGVESLYRIYIQDWKPDRPGDIPACPPNTRGNADLWRAWWRRVEAVKPRTFVPQEEDEKNSDHF